MRSFYIALISSDKIIAVRQFEDINELRDFAEWAIHNQAPSIQPTDGIEAILGKMALNIKDSTKALYAIRMSRHSVASILSYNTDIENHTEIKQ